MKIITVNLTDPQTKALAVLQQIGLYPSRSEAIRVALRDFLQRAFDLVTTNGTEQRESLCLSEKIQNSPVVDKEQIGKTIGILLRRLEEEIPMGA